MKTAITAFLAFWLLATTAWAEDPDPRIAAVDALNRANELASKGKYNDAVGYYEKAIKLDGVNNELAYYNLAEVQKVRGNCRAAVLTFELYAALVGTPESRKEVDKAIKGCKKSAWTTLELKADPVAGAEIYINDMLASPTGVFGPVVVPPGTYEVRFEAADHHPEQRTVEVKAEPVTMTQALKKMTFFGTVTVKVDVPDARIRVFEGPTDKSEALFDGKAPLEKGVKAREGRHFVEVTAKGYKRWIRNVTVGRDVDTEVKVSLTRELPPEIR